MLPIWARASLLVVLLASGGCASAASSPAVAPPAVATAVSRDANANPTSAPLRPLKMAYAFATAETVPMWVAEDQGLYRKHGLEVETILMQSSAQVAPAMAAGEHDGEQGSTRPGQQHTDLHSSNDLLAAAHAAHEAALVQLADQAVVGQVRRSSAAHLRPLARHRVDHALDRLGRGIGYRLQVRDEYLVAAVE